MPLSLGPGFRLGARWTRLVEPVKTRKRREKTGEEWARYGLKRVKESGSPGGLEQGKYPIMDEVWGSTKVKNLYFAGTPMHGRDYRKSSGGFIHGFRYLIRAQNRCRNALHALLTPRLSRC